MYMYLHEEKCLMGIFNCDNQGLCHYVCIVLQASPPRFLSNNNLISLIGCDCVTLILALVFLAGGRDFGMGIKNGKFFTHIFV